MNKKIIVTGGGSGGHISVASAIISHLLENKKLPKQNLLYVGGDLGMENEKNSLSLEQKKFKDATFRTTYIRAGKLQRQLSPKSIKLLLRTLLGIIDSFKIIKQEKPDIIISTGGFVSVPVCLVGKLFRKKIYLHEQTATVGLANQIVGKFANRIYIAFKTSEQYFKKERTLLVGNIVRDAVTTKNYKNTTTEFKKIIEQNNKHPLIYISGGGLGSHLLNDKVLRELDSLLSKYRIILQMGDNQEFKDYEVATSLRKTLEPNKAKRFLPVKFIDDNNIGYVYNNMDLFIGRAGANTVYEIGVLAKPSIFVPIPWVTHNEQYLNAKVLKDIGLSEIIEERNFPSINLENSISQITKQLEKKDIDYGKLNKLFPTNATEILFEDLLNS